MKVCYLLLSLLVAGAVHAQRVPKSVFHASDYAEAKAKAVEEGKNIAIISTEIDSSCPKCVFGTDVAMKAMRSKYVLVLENDGADPATGELPTKIKRKTYLVMNEKGNVTPIVTVLSPTNDQLLSGACYKQISADKRKWLKDVEAEIASKPIAPSKPSKESEERSATTVTDKPAESDDGGLRSWTDVRGRSMEAELIHADDLTATFKLVSGKVIELPLAKLSPESQETIKELSH